MRTFSDEDMSVSTIKSFGGAMHTLSELAREGDNKKDLLHKEALDKITALLDTKDEYTAKAVKAIIYKKVTDANPELSGLDKIAETLKIITADSVQDALKDTETINQIVNHLKEKDVSRKKHLSAKSEDKTEEKTEENRRKSENPRRM